MNIVITGASGYIGSVLCKYSKRRGHKVLGIDHNRPYHKYYDKFITCNFRSDEAVDIISTWEADVIFHLAASADVADSTVNPTLYYDNNTGATAELIYRLISKGINVPIIFSSTAAVYGDSKERFKESSLKAPINSYGYSKLMCEKILQDAFLCNDISSVSFRYFNVAGAFEDVGDHSNSSHVIQRLCSAELNNTQFELYGTDYDTHDKTCVRDYIHVIDICSAHFYAYDLLKERKGSHVFNLGTGYGTSVKQLTELFNVDVIFKQRRLGDPASLVADGTEFMSATGFKYKHSFIDKIVDSARDWFKISKDKHAH